MSVLNADAATDPKGPLRDPLQIRLLAPSETAAFKTSATVVGACPDRATDRQETMNSGDAASVINPAVRPRGRKPDSASQPQAVSSDCWGDRSDCHAGVVIETGCAGCVHDAVGDAVGGVVVRGDAGCDCFADRVRLFRFARVDLAYERFPDTV